MSSAAINQFDLKHKQEMDLYFNKKTREIGIMPYNRSTGDSYRMYITAAPAQYGRIQVHHQPDIGG